MRSGELCLYGILGAGWFFGSLHLRRDARVGVLHRCVDLGCTAERERKRLLIFDDGFDECVPPAMQRACHQGSS